MCLLRHSTTIQEIQFIEMFYFIIHEKNIFIHNAKYFVLFSVHVEVERFCLIFCTRHNILKIQMYWERKILYLSKLLIFFDIRQENWYRREQKYTICYER